MFKKLNIFLLILLLIFSFIPTQDLTTFAEMKQIDDSNNEHIKVVLFSEQKDSDIFLYADIKGEEIITTIPDGTEVTLIDLETENEELALIRYEIINDKNKVEKFEGYVHIGSIFSLEEAEVFRENRSQVLDESELEKNEKSINELEKESIVEKSELKEDKEEDEKPKQEKSTDISNRSVLKPSSENNRTMAINVVNVKEESTSLLGHIRNRNVKIYQDLTNLNQSVVSGEEYTNRVYFIKKRAIVNGQTYYFLSTRSNPSLGPVGWVKAEDMVVKNHVGVDKEAKTFYVKGTNYSYDTAWGGAKNRVHDLTQYKDHVFEVHLTEKAGNTTWYRGVLGGKTVWIEEQYLTTAEEKSTSLLGHIRSRNVKISEKLGDFTNAFTAGAEYTNQVYYIKKEAVINGQKYYLLSTRASSTIGVVGWAKAEDIAVKTHITLDNKQKMFLIKGIGKATSKAWGGNKDVVYSDLSKHKNTLFQVNLTEKVGSETWYRGIIDGVQVWLKSDQVVDMKIDKTSLLGHIRNRNVQIYEFPGGKSVTAGSTYTNAVYYIKAEGTYNGQKYYLLSKSPSVTQGVIGWAKASDISAKSHVTVDKISKVLYVKGTGQAWSKAWGGKKDLVYENLNKYKEQPLKINLTEKVGNETWHRGMLDGKQVWIKATDLEAAKGTRTSRLGHIKSRNVLIYEWIGGRSFSAGTEYTNHVYYIKLEKMVGSQKYYLISKSPSSINGVVGWVKEQDMDSYEHITVDNKEKVFYLNGNGRATTKAWGGKKDAVYDPLKDFEGKLIFVNLTEKVGTNIWYRGKINDNGPNVWVHANWVTKTYETYVHYNLTIQQAVQIQRQSAINTIWKNGKWITANEKEIEAYLNPTNFINDEIQRFQFLDLSKRSGAPEHILRAHLQGKGVLSGQEKAFIKASNENDVNELYLIAHARLETGNGTSSLSNGSIEVGEITNNKYVIIEKVGSGQKIYIAEYKQIMDDKGNKKWDWVINQADNFNRNDAKNYRKIYNMFGIGAVDKNPILGAIHAYKNGWYTVEAAIVGGAKWISEQYINNQYKQNTLYKMRWNPQMADAAWKQYASDVAWASKQVPIIYNIFKDIGFENVALSFHYPVYK